jgi:hypothetical protein
VSHNYLIGADLATLDRKARWLQSLRNSCIVPEVTPRSGMSASFSSALSP